MAQAVGVDPAEPGAATGGGHDLQHASACEGIVGRPDSHKYCPALGGPGTAVAQIGRHRFADIGRQGKVFDAASFAPYENLTGPPIQVVKLELGDFPRPQAETNQHGQDREVAAAVRRIAAAGRQQALNLVAIQSLWQPSQSPTGDRGHASGKRSRDETLDMKEREQRPQRRYSQACRAAAQLRATCHDKGDDVGRGQTRKVQGTPVGRQSMTQKGSHHPGIDIGGRFPQTALNRQIALVSFQQLICRIVGCTGDGSTTPRDCK